MVTIMQQLREAAVNELHDPNVKYSDHVGAVNSGGCVFYEPLTVKQVDTPLIV